MSLAGFYRGVVKNNDDSSLPIPYRGFVQVYVPQVYGTNLRIPEELPWAEPCMPIYGGGRVDGVVSHGVIAIPPLESTVWVGFEQGDPQRPIYFGSWFGPGELPEAAKRVEGAAAQYPDIFLLKFPGGSGHLKNQLEQADDRKLSEFSGFFVRTVGDEKIEIVVEEGKNSVSFDRTRGVVQLNVSGWDVEVKSSAIRDRDGNIVETGNIRLEAEGGRIELKCDRFILQCDTDAHLQANGQLILQGRDSAVLASDREIHGAALSATGFETR